MSNLSKKKREKLIDFLNILRENNNDNEEYLQAIGEIETELNSKKYGLVWEKHEEEVDVKMKTNIPVFTEVKDREIEANKNGKYNFLLEGDNLHSLKLLQKTHNGKIDVIYIDPPYNTGNNDFIYNDKMIGEDDGYRHSKWLSFMSERLEIAKTILSDEGLIFISIDDNELAQLKLLCDHIFGEKNFIATINIQTARNVYGPKASSLNKTIVKVKEYLFVYTKNKERIDFLNPLKTSKRNKFDSHFNRAIIDNKIVSWKSIIEKDKYILKELAKYNLTLSHRNLEIVFTLNNKLYQYFLKEYSSKIYQDSAFTSKIIGYEKELGKGKVVKINEIYVFQGLDGKSKPRFLTPLSKSITQSDDYLGELSDTAYRGNSWDYSDDMNNIGKEGGVAFKSGKKPLRLIKDILKLINNKNAIILDFFAGSGTTGHAVMQLNKEDGGSRTYIMCTNNENKIAEEITYKRMVNIQSELPHNLKYYKTDFIDKDDEELTDKMLEHIEEMVQLERGVKIDNNEYVLVLSDSDADKLTANISKYDKLKAIYMSSDVLLSGKQKRILEDYEINIIPDYYFGFELREAGLIW